MTQYYYGMTVGAAVALAVVAVLLLVLALLRPQKELDNNDMEAFYRMLSEEDGETREQD